MTPMTIEAADAMVSELAGTLNFFPREPEERVGIAKQILLIVEYEEQGQWLVTRMAQLYDRWTGTHEMRACYSSKFKPKDGRSIYSAVFEDGIPSERKPQSALLTPAEQRLLLESGAVTVDSQLDRSVRGLIQITDLRRRIAQRPSSPGPITQADIDRAVQANRDAAARRELFSGDDEANEGEDAE